MRCPRCHSEVPPAALNCLRCGYQTPAGKSAATSRSASPDTEKKDTKKQTPVEPQSSSLLPGKLGSLINKYPFLSKLQNLNVGAPTIGVMVLVLAAVVGWPLKEIFHVCLTCPDIQGRYEGPADVGNSKATIRVELLQTGTNVNGVAVIQFTEGELAGRKSVVPLDGTNLTSQNVLLKAQDGIADRFVFNAQIAGDSLTGDITLGIDSLNAGGSGIKFKGIRK